METEKKALLKMVDEVEKILDKEIGEPVRKAVPVRKGKAQYTAKLVMNGALMAMKELRRLKQEIEYDIRRGGIDESEASDVNSMFAKTVRAVSEAVVSVVAAAGAGRAGAGAI